MKAVILAGGLGTRIAEETHLKPKPMVEVGGMPILWHIMKIYACNGISDFIICCGYKGDIIKEYFANYFLYMSDVTVDLGNNSMSVHNKYSEDWKVTLVNTGAETQTGGRLLRVKEYLEGEGSFFFTYGDGVGDLDIQSTIKFHNLHGKKATMSVACPPSRFGTVTEKDGLVTSFKEKPITEGEVINAGFFVLSSDIFHYLEDDKTIWEEKPLMKLTSEGQLMCWRHNGFWQPMDTLRDKNFLEDLWQNENAPWKIWE